MTLSSNSMQSLSPRISELYPKLPEPLSVIKKAR